MGKKKDAVKENATLIKNYINEVITENDEMDERNGHTYQSSVTLYLKSIQKIIRAKKKFVLDLKTITDTYDRNANFNMFSADKIRIIFCDNEEFYIGFDTEISDHRKRFLPIGGDSVLEYELMEKISDNFVSIKLSDICSYEKMFSYESIETLKLIISKTIEEYPDFYDRLFSEKKGVQKTILN